MALSPPVPVMRVHLGENVSGKGRVRRPLYWLSALKMFSERNCETLAYLAILGSWLGARSAVIMRAFRRIGTTHSSGSEAGNEARPDVPCSVII